jgi:hypothetical protein
VLQLQVVPRPNPSKTVLDLGQNTRLVPNTPDHARSRQVIVIIYQNHHLPPLCSSATTCLHSRSLLLLLR